MTPDEIRAKADESGLISVVPPDVLERLQTDARSHANLWGQEQSRDSCALSYLVAAGNAWLEGYLTALEQGQAARN